MDGIQRYSTNVDDRPQTGSNEPTLRSRRELPSTSVGTATGAYIDTTDIAAGDGAETVLASDGYGDSVTFVNGFRFVEDLRSSAR